MCKAFSLKSYLASTLIPYFPIPRFFPILFAYSFYFFSMKISPRLMSFSVRVLRVMVW